jgi:rhodanese-related sulfurtransferase
VVQLDPEYSGLLSFLVLAVSACSSGNDIDLLSIKDSGEIISIDSMEVNKAPSYDWGDINIMGGNISHEFAFKNDSDEDLVLKGATTSCMCTTASIELPDGTQSPKFGMHNNAQWAKIIPAQASFKVNVVYDPMAHGPEGTGDILRSVFLATSSKAHGNIANYESENDLNTVTEIKVQAKVFSEEDFTKLTPEYPIRMGDFMFQEDEYNFGIVKQSQGIITHDFPFQYTGEKDLSITGTPTSCACTEAEISVTELKMNDTGVLTVKFDPNLHEEPEGKFFKTVTILTTPDLEEQPEVKIWVEMDLDLGVDAYKLSQHIDDHNDDDEHADGKEYHNIQGDELKSMLTKKDFFLLDVHIPEQEHIKGTDAFIDYTTIKDNKDKLPKNLDEKIVVYCRSGSMSRAASKDLIDLGYTNVLNLDGGIEIFNAL